jgi:hypothetical protein
MIESSDFDAALARSWWTVYELRGKILNALWNDDLPTVMYGAWSFAYWAAMRIALHDQVPYESARTLWSDVTTRSNQMKDLIDALLMVPGAALAPSVGAVWEYMESWGSPES